MPKVSSNNSLPNTQEDIKNLIMKKVEEAEELNRTQQKYLDPKAKTRYINNKIINWPPERDDLENLCKAMNLRVPEK